MEQSILKSVKKILQIDESYTVFDLDIITHINSVFSTLHQLGVGPQSGFMIEDATSEWDEFLGASPVLNSVKTYVYLRVRLLFDPPETSYHIDAIKDQVKELEWRINMQYESTLLPSRFLSDTDLDFVIDGGVIT